MLSRRKIGAVTLAALLGGALGAPAYERALNPRSLREAYFLGKDTTFRLTDFLKPYVQTFPAPRHGVHVERVELITPFKAMTDRTRRALDAYSPLKAEADYRRQPPPLAVKVTLRLTPTFPAHSPYGLPGFEPVYFREPDFWRAFDVHLVQRGDVEPQARRGYPLITCSDVVCTLVGAVLTLEFDPAKVASRPARVLVFTPDGQEVEANFELGRLR
ncbi:MAG: hypothetical protein ACE5HL_13090 [Terriglobia bacterium]